jgi:hypothetical protein
MLRKPPEMLDEFSVSTALISPYSSKMTDLGNITDSIYSATAQGIFHNGYVYKDGVSYSDNPDNKTYNFTYKSLLQVSDAQGNPNYAGEYLKMTAVKAEATGGTFEQDHDSSTMMGMEVDWTHYFDNRRRFGFVMGLNNAGFSFAHSADWEVRMTADNYLYHGIGLEGRDGFSGSYYRPVVFSPERPETFIYLGDPVFLGSTDLGTVTASGNWKMNAAFMTMKIGGVYNFSVTRRFIVRFSGGLSLIGASTRFAWNETYTAPLESGDASIVATGNKTTMKVLFGAWGDIGAHYRINRKVTVYGALQAQTAQSYSDTTKYGHHIEVDASSTYMMRTGFTWAF